MCDSTSEFSQMGVGYAIYFDTAKFLILVTALTLGVVAGVDIYLNYGGNGSVNIEDLPLIKETIKNFNYTQFDRNQETESKSIFQSINIFGDSSLTL